jgi:hypothetical protein
MKLFRRVWVVALLAVCATMWAGDAWADVNSVKAAIENYGLNAEVSGNTITITGSKRNATKALPLMSISNGTITYDWNATLTADCETFPPTWQNSKNRALILFDMPHDNDVIFNIKGGEISFTDKKLVRTYDDTDSAYVIYNNPRSTPLAEKVHVVLDGGVVSTDMRDIVAINLQSREVDGKDQGAGWVDLKNGTIYVPFGEALEADLGRCTIDDSAVQSGALKITGLVDGFGYNHRVYGNTTMSSAETDEEYKWEGHSITVMDEATFTTAQNLELGVEFMFNVASGGKWIHEKDFKIELNGTDSLIRIGEGGVLDNYGTIVITNGKFEDIGEVNNYGTIIVNGELYVGNSSQAGAENFKSATLPLVTANATFNNYGTTTISAAGKITNNGIVNNDKTGTITNEGKIDGDGTIANKGKIKSDPANISDSVTITDNPVEPIETSTSGSGSSSGGCNTGLGLFGLLLAGLVTRTYRKA